MDYDLKRFSWGWLFPLSLISVQVSAQSDPGFFTNVIDAPPTTVAANTQLPSGTQLNVFAGGLVGSLVSLGEPGAGSNTPATEANIYGGQIGNGFSVNPYSVLNVYGGSIEPSILLFEHSTLNLHAGDLNGGIWLTGAAEINISGGSIGQNFRVISSGSPPTVLNISGGQIDRGLQVGGADLMITGGDFGRGFDVAGAVGDVAGGTYEGLFISSEGLVVSGGAFLSRWHSDRGEFGTVVGDHFTLNGNPVSSGPILLSDDDVLAGVLVDGNSILIAPARGDTTGTIHLTPGSPPAADSELMLLTTPAPKELLTLRPGHNVIVDHGGSLPSGTTVVGATIELRGGEIGETAEFSNSAITIQEGSVGDHAALFAGADLTVDGGWIGESLEIYHGGTLTVRRGAVGADVETFDGALVVVLGGSVGRSSEIHDGGQLQVDAGFVADRLRVEPGGRMQMTGGSIGREFGVEEGGSLIWSGGVIADDFFAGNGAMEIVGGEFMLDGQPITGTSVSLEQSVFGNWPPENTRTLTGTLSDGTPFLFSPSASDSVRNIQLTTAPLDPVADSTIVVASDTPASVAGLRSGQSLELHAGGQLPRYFTAVEAELSIQDGLVQDGFEAIGSRIVMNGGSIEGRTHLYRGTEFQLKGGEVESLVLTTDVSMIHHEGLVSHLYVYPGGSAETYGGTISEWARVESGSYLKVAGGQWTSDIHVRENGELEIVGTEFTLNGSPISGLSLNGSYLLDQRWGKLDVTLADGQSFSIDLGGFSGSVDSNLPHFHEDMVLRLSLVAATRQIGDWNDDGFVSQSDLDLVLLNWGSEQRPVNWGISHAFDGLMSQNELDDVLLNWGNGMHPSIRSVAAGVPEPGTLVLVLSGALTTVRRRVGWESILRTNSRV